MCNALEELRQEGRWEGILEGIRATVRTCRNFNISEADAVRNIMNKFSLSQEEAVNYVKKYWLKKNISKSLWSIWSGALYLYWDKI